MKAVVKFGRHDGDVELREVPEPIIQPNQVLIEVAAVSVCGSDIHLWHENQSWPIKLPVILGHEFSGRIIKVGSQISGFHVGDRVVCETAAEVCGQCIYCLTGNYNLCPKRKGYGNLIDGAMTRYIVARPTILHRIPENVSFENAALTEPICVVNNALVEKSKIKPGDIVVIQGSGAIGLLALQLLKLIGVSIIIVLGTDIDKYRLEIAKKLGAHYTVNIQRKDPVKLVRSLRDGLGADCVVDCTGVSRALKQAMEIVRPNGCITKIGWGPEPLDFSLDPLVAKAVTLQGSFSHTYGTWERTLHLMESDQLDLHTIIGGVYPIDKWKEAFVKMESGQNVKSIIKIN